MTLKDSCVVLKKTRLPGSKFVFFVFCKKEGGCSFFSSFKKGKATAFFSQISPLSCLDLSSFFPLKNGAFRYELCLEKVHMEKYINVNLYKIINFMQ